MEIKVCIAALVLKYFSGEVLAGIGSSIILQLAARVANTHQGCVDIHQWVYGKEKLCYGCLF